MNDDIRRQALRTTAKIALSLTVFGCGGTVEVADQTASATDDPVADPVSGYPQEEQAEDEREPVEAPAYEEETLVCDAAPVGEEVAILDEAQLDCCMDYLEPLWPESTAEGWEQWQSTMEDPDVGGCCNVVATHVDEAGGGPKR